MRRRPALGLAVLASASLVVVLSVPAAAAQVDVMVVGRSAVLRPATTVSARTTTVQVGARRCAVAANTPLAALAALRRPAFHVRDFGACSRRSTRASESLFVDRVGNERNRGVDGWVYKTGRRAPGIGAGALGARVRAGAKVLWFYCRQGPRGCQRTLEVTASTARAAPGAPLAFTVRGYDDRGRGVPVTGARVRFAGTELRTGAGGRVDTTAPAVARPYRATAELSGLVPSFPVEVTVG
jgi:hypothetical protein